MKMKTLAVMAGVATPLIVTGSASAGFLGIKATSKPNEFGLLVVNVYAIFDRPDPGDGSGDHMLAVAGTHDSPLVIQVTGGTFYNHDFGSDSAPQAFIVDLFPSLAYDTFVTIGVKKWGDPKVYPGSQPADSLTITTGFPTGITGSVLQTSEAGWAVIPSAPQGDPFDPVNSFPGNGQILIGQFATADGTAISGTMLVQYLSNGKNDYSIVSFGVPTPGALAMLGVAGLIGTRRRRRHRWG